MISKPLTDKNFKFTAARTKGFQRKAISLQDFVEIYGPEKGPDEFKFFDEYENVDVVQVKWPQNIQTTRGHFDKFSLNTSFVKKDTDKEGRLVSAHDGIE